MSETVGAEGIVGFDHLSFTVPDIEGAVRFWTAALGFRAASLSPRSGAWQSDVTGVPGAQLLVAHLHGHGQHVEFIQYLAGGTAAGPSDPGRIGTAHVCFVVSGIEAVWQRLLAAGATPQGRIASVDSGPATGCRAGYLRDPSGIVIELVEHRESTPKG
jgi:catechol 2,3-dioxygenase-like lactoylglutathione lyase family enzyme